ncbi:MAG TPA: DegT/DnrJ/EryC1/StrS family aminotransferase [Candidatus Dormibacteraeota bacterium]
MAVSVVATEPIPFTRTVITSRARQAALRVLASGWVTSGPEVMAFESDFARWVGAKHAVGVSSCTAAIEISLRALRLPANSRVLTSTITFCGAIHAIVHAGYRPVLADVDPVTLMPNPETIERAVGDGVQAMVVTHYAGHGAQLMESATAARLPLSRVVEDAAHALGTQIGGRRIGSISGATCFSFYATKNLPIGEGGMITTDNPNLAADAGRLRIHGMSGDAWRRYMPGASWRYNVNDDGIKANMTDVQAAIGRVHLQSLTAWQRRREELAAHYDLHLANVPGITTPARPGDGKHAWHLYVIRVRPEFGMTRDELVAGLQELGIHCSVHFIPNHLQPYFRKFVNRDADFRHADAAFREIVSLPFYHSLTTREVERVCLAISTLGASRRRFQLAAHAAAFRS